MIRYISGLFTTFSVLTGFFLSVSVCQAQRIFWTERGNDRIMVGDLTPAGIVNPQVLISGLNSPTAITTDVQDERIFFTNNGAEDIISASIYDGSNQVPLVTTGAMAGFDDLAYSGSDNVFAANTYEVKGAERVNASSGSTTSLPLGSFGGDYFIGIAVSDNAGYVFLADYNTDDVFAADFNGTPSGGLALPSGVENLAVDDINNHLYFTRVNPLDNQNELYLCAFDGSNLSPGFPLSTASQITSLQVYPQFNKVYYVIQGQGIYSANLDGTSPGTLEIALTGTGVWDIGIAADYESPIFTALTPADGTTDVDPSTTTLVMKFNERVQVSTVPAAGDDEVQLVDAGGNVTLIPRSSLTFSSADSTVSIPVSLNQAEDYHLLIGPHVVADLSGNDFTGISQTTGWNFTTACTSLTAGTAAADQGVCQGGDPALIMGGTASGGDDVFTYQWESSTTSSTGGFTAISGATGADYDPPAGISATTYYRRIVSSATCTPATGNPVTVSVATPPVIGTQPADQEICEYDFAIFDVAATAGTAGNTLTYQWQVDDGTGFTDITDNGTYFGSTGSQLNVFNPAGLSGYRYQCVITEGGACSITSGVAMLTVNTIPAITDVTPSVCEETAGSGTAPFDLTSLEATLAGSQTDLGFEWFMDPDYVTPVAQPTNVTVSDATEFYVRVKNNTTGCDNQAKAIFSLTKAPTAIASPNPVAMCSGATATVTLSGGDTYAWTVSTNDQVTGASAGSGTSIDLSLTNTSTVQQQVEYTVIPSQSGCPGAEAVVSVTVDPEPTMFNVTEGGSSCRGNGGVLVGLDDSQAGITYSLLLNGSATGTTATPGGGAFEFPGVTTDGPYTVQGATANNCLAIMNGSVQVQMLDLPSGTGTINNSNASVCAGLTEAYQVTGITNAASYAWTVPADYEITSGDGTDNITLLIGSSAFTISVTGENECGTGGSAQLSLTMLPSPSVAIVLPATDVYAAEPALFSYTTAATVQGGTWDFGDGGTASGQDVEYTYTAGGSYEVSLEITDPMGCVGKDAKTLTVRPKAGLSDASIKNVVTANGDDKNAFLYIQDIHKFPGNEVLLLDRWGVEVFRKKGYNNEWNLVKDGGFIPAGNYVCVVKLEETGEIFKRAITVIKGN